MTGELTGGNSRFQLQEISLDQRVDFVESAACWPGVAGSAGARCGAAVGDGLARAFG